jgi:hypothetical protein
MFVLVCVRLLYDQTTRRHTHLYVAFKFLGMRLMLCFAASEDTVAYPDAYGDTTRRDESAVAYPDAYADSQERRDESAVAYPDAYADSQERRDESAVAYPDVYRDVA